MLTSGNFPPAISTISNCQGLLSHRECQRTTLLLKILIMLIMRWKIWSVKQMSAFNRLIYKETWQAFGRIGFTNTHFILIWFEYTCLSIRLNLHCFSSEECLKWEKNQLMFIATQVTSCGILLFISSVCRDRCFGLQSFGWVSRVSCLLDYFQLIKLLWYQVGFEVPNRSYIEWGTKEYLTFWGCLLIRILYFESQRHSLQSAVFF